MAGSSGIWIICSCTPGWTITALAKYVDALFWYLFWQWVLSINIPATPFHTRNNSIYINIYENNKTFIFNIYINKIVIF